MREAQSNGKQNSTMNPGADFPTVPLSEVPAPVPVPDRPVVLVVDDESTIADTLAVILSRSGFAAIAAYDGECALETALLVPPDLVISDVMMPGMNGIELAISVQRALPDCKVILFSGKAATADILATAGREGHSFVLLSKPVHPKDLLVRISEALKPAGAARSEGVI